MALISGFGGGCDNIRIIRLEEILIDLLVLVLVWE